MTDILARLTAALADRYRIERELGQGGPLRPASGGPAKPAAGTPAMPLGCCKVESVSPY